MESKGPSWLQDFLGLKQLCTSALRFMQKWVVDFVLHLFIYFLKGGVG